MIINVIHEGQAYRLEAPDGCQVSRHGHKPPVMGEALDDVLRVRTEQGVVSLPTPLVIYAASKGLHGLKVLDGPTPHA
jgi:hypothetical protein